MVAQHPHDVRRSAEQQITDLDSRLSLVLSDYNDSDDNFERRLQTLDSAVTTSCDEIAKLQTRIAQLERLRTEMVENRSGGPRLVAELREQRRVLAGQVAASNAALILDELRKLGISPEDMEIALKVAKSARK